MIELILMFEERCKYIEICVLRKTIQKYGVGEILTHQLNLPCYNSKLAKDCPTYQVMENQEIILITETTDRSFSHPSSPTRQF